MRKVIVDLNAGPLSPGCGGAYRWIAVVTYRSESGPIDVIHEFEELYEIHALIEAGPDWSCIADIRISLSEQRRADYGTLEAAARR